MTQIEARQPAIVYVTRHCEDKDDIDVIASMFFIYSVPYFTLINVGSTHSYITSTISLKLNITVECITSVISVVSLLGQSVRVDKVFKRVPLEV